MWKLEFIEGAVEFVLEELQEIQPNFHIHKKDSRHIYIDDTNVSLQSLLQLRTVTKVFYAVQDDVYTPKYLYKHKSIVKEVVSRIDNLEDFSNFYLKCAGEDTHEVGAIRDYIAQEFKISHVDVDPDLKIQIIKTDGIWEVNVQMTSRPLSVRDYRVSHVRGALNPTIAYAMCMLGEVEKADSVLNPFCGSGTFLIEAFVRNSQLSRVVGFDIDKEALTASHHNVKEAELIRKVDIKALDIMDTPKVSDTFDIVISDLPFGMIVSKYVNLEDLYREYLSLAEEVLHSEGRLVTVTSQNELFIQLVEESKFHIEKIIPLTQMTSVGAYLKTKIFLCTL